VESNTGELLPFQKESGKFGQPNHPAQFLCVAQELSESQILDADTDPCAAPRQTFNYLKSIGFLRCGSLARSLNS
jgi:hypothetical protein